MTDTNNAPKKFNWILTLKIIGFVILGIIAFEVIRMIIAFFSGIGKFGKGISEIIGSTIEYIAGDFRQNCGAQPECSVKKDETTCTNEPKCGWDQDQKIGEQCVNKEGRKTGESGSGWKCALDIFGLLAFVIGGPLIYAAWGRARANKTIKTESAQSDTPTDQIQDKIKLKTSKEVVDARNKNEVTDEAIVDFTKAVGNRKLYDSAKTSIEKSIGNPTERAESLSRLNAERSLAYEKIKADAEQNFREDIITQKDLDKIKEFEIPKL